MRPITAAGIALAAAISIVTAAHAQQSTKPQTPPEKMQQTTNKKDANANPTATTEKPQTTRTAQRRRNYAHVRHRVLPKCDAWAMSNFGVCW